LDDEQQEYAGIVLKEADHLLSIINDILDFSKIEAGKLILDNQEFAPVTVVESVAELLSAQEAAKHLSLMTFVAPDVPLIVRGDAGRLRQVLLNLVGNAIKFTDTGDVVVRLNVDAITESHVILRGAVKDSGIGLSKAAQQRLFQPFTQVDGGTTRRHGGTGLGLAIAGRLVELMAGQVGIESEEGQGATFWFTVRLERSHAKPATELVQTIDLQGLRALVVDDNATHCDILQAYLSAWGMQVDCVNGGADALKQLLNSAAAGQPYDVAIVDQLMPGMDGLALGQLVRAEASLTTTCLIMLTGFDEKGQGQHAVDIGYAAYLTKPVHQARLREALSRVMAGRRPLTSVAAPVTSSNPAQSRPVRSYPPVRPVDNGLNADATILLVEDQKANQELAIQQLAKLGYKAKLAQNGQEALDRIARPDHGYQLILMDCQMPHMDGFEATRRIRALEQENGQDPIPIIAMTAQAMKGDRERCLAAGMDDYISKPVRMADLEQALARCLHPTLVHPSS
ncbi:MAG: response regulator, partial [Chloroflexi bacterium]|nr:response regulator [Chloroflexota bacterium]